MALNEDQIDRRAHWFQIVVGLIIVATAWCVKLELNSSQQSDDAKQYKKDMKVNFKEMDNKGDDLDHRVIVLETIQACRDGKINCK